MNEIRVTVHGNVVAEPVERTTRTGGVFTTFRIASTPRRRTIDGRFVDGDTSYFGVIAFNALGANVTVSLQKGQPVIVEGRLSTREWQAADGTTRQSIEVDADHVGHDLGWGRAQFSRLSRAAALGHDRMVEPEVAEAMTNLAEGRPANVDADGVVHDEPRPAPDDDSTSEPDHPADRVADRVPDDAETDDYEVLQRSA
ncbi:single-stranded DNA-binding protein [Terracoccus luteus]|uniref:Single-stranded DNA-binding protein n=1 Tax=Terracoccus luteus TaxID=53356 RepID=A0A839PVA5_9MICO|nr:single-stranded DNA-binding protein [Terracoccus luteus]MBB2986963.1 single-strand DNA-binding protein [Terracoccus luteus]MCP2172614.1 single-strand DNA-binding protein [Terracoccus luteus]